jgi:hypothetical protein
MVKKPLRTNWHYRRMIAEYEKRSAIILNGVIDRHKDLISTLDGPAAKDAEGRSLQRRFFRTVLTTQAASLLVRKPSIVRELLARYAKDGQPLPLDEHGFPVFPSVEVEDP